MPSRRADIDTTQLAHDYAAGATLRQLGERYHYSHAAIATLLAAAGVPRRRTWGRYRDCPTCGHSFYAKRGRVHCSNSCRRGDTPH